MIRVFIVAAPPLARAGLENLLAAREVEVVASAATIDALADVLSDTAPDIVLIDSSGEPFEAALESVTASGLPSDVSVVVLGDAISAAASADALRAGIRAALPSDISPEQLLSTLHAVATGLLVLHPSWAAEALPATPSATRATEDLAEALTRREVEVLQLLAGGLSNKEIASGLRISEHTVKFHVASILGKMGAATRTEAVSLGVRRGLILL